MYDETINTVNTASSVAVVDSELENLQNWAAPIPEKNEVYPRYWAMRGWRCFNTAV